MCIFWVFLTLGQILMMSLSLNAQSNCSLLRDNFASSTSEFIACAIANSRPIILCENCVQFYLRANESYTDMTQSSENGTYCIDRFINLDRLQIVQTLHSNSDNLWNDAKCYECFQVVDGKLTSNKSVETLKFNEYHTNFMNCVNNQKEINDTSLCSTCMETYLKLVNYYVSITNENEQIGGCMDIIDMMNTTRSFWSPKCCKYRKHHEYVFLVSTILVLIVTLCFYILAQFCTVKKSPTIYQQSRFAESLSQTSHS